MAPTVSFVWSVVSTMCPVSAAWTACWAVSASRTSPTMTTSGSWRRTWRRASAKLVPVFGFAAIWLKSSRTISMGSSMVTTFTSGEARAWSAE